MGFDLEPTEEQRALRQTLSDFAASELRPRAREFEAAGAVPPDVLEALHGIGVTAPVDESYGGGGTLDAVTYVMAVEEVAWGDAAAAYAVFGAGLAALVVGRAGSDDQRRRLLGRFCGERPYASFVAVTEKLAAGDLTALETEVGPDKVRGTKYGVPAAREAGFGVVVGRDGTGELAAAVVEPSAWEVAAPEDKLGLEAAPTYVVDFDGPAEPFPAGPDLLGAVLLAKLMPAAVALGNARASLEYASRYATEREAFGRPIGAFQGISFKIADMATLVDSARLALWRAAWEVDRKTATPARVAEAVGQCLTAAVLCGDDGVQILGGHGYVQDHPVEMWFRNAVTLSATDSPELVGDLVVARGTQ